MTKHKVTIYFAHDIKFVFYNVTIERIAEIQAWYEGMGQRLYEISDDYGRYQLNREYVCAIQYNGM